MQLALFWIFSALMLIFGAAVIFLRNPVSSALSLVVSFVFLAALFVTLDAFFIGVVQVLVYAGAVMVLFLFIIMLLNLRSERPRPLNIGAWTGGGLVVFGFVGLLGKVLSSELRIRHGEAADFDAQISDVSADRIDALPLFQSPFPNHRRPPFGRHCWRRHPQQQGTEMTPTLGHYLAVSGLLFAIGLAGVILRRNIIVIFMCLELMLNAANFSLVAFSRFNVNRCGSAEL